jgi:hypothetical protein
MPSDERCETCVYWGAPVTEGRRICRKFDYLVGAWARCGFWKPVPLPFGDEPVEEEAANG